MTTTTTTTSLVKCTRRGCGKLFNPLNNNSNEGESISCQFHSEAPLFHEGLKSWSCCTKINRGVTDFNDFLAIKGCCFGTHSIEPLPLPPVKPVEGEEKDSVMIKDGEGREVYGTSQSTSSLTLPLPPAPTPTSTLVPSKPISTEYVEEQDDSEITILKGTTCKRRGCGINYNGESREDEICRYHPGSPIFHEGTKMNSCCKPKAMDFDEFLAIKGCRTGKHLYVGAAKKLSKKNDDDDEEVVEEMVECRVDHYQTPREVHISVFGKGANKETSSVKFEEESMEINLNLPLSKKFSKTFTLYGPINPTTSTYTILGTKCEIILQKADARSWPSITQLASNAFVPQLAFSSGGGRGTTGAKEAVLDSQNRK